MVSDFAEIDTGIREIPRWWYRIFGDQETREAREKPKLVPTYRPIELMLEGSGEKPEFFKGKRVLNVGAGKTHWGWDLTQKYGVVAAKFDNLDVDYVHQGLTRRIAGKAFFAENIGNIKDRLPYGDDQYDVLWCSVAPVNIPEFFRVVKPGGQIYIVGGRDKYPEGLLDDMKRQTNGRGVFTVKNLGFEFGKKYSAGQAVLKIEKPNEASKSF